MNIYPISLTRAQKIERKAKLRRKADPSLKVEPSLDREAQADGFLHWRHVTLCRTQGERQKQRLSLTVRLGGILAEAQQRFSVSERTVQAFSSGIVVAIDVVDARQLDALSGYFEVPDCWHLAGMDIWAASSASLRAEYPQEDERASDTRVLDDFTCLRFFSIDPVPVGNASLRSVVDLVSVPVQWCWIEGKASRVAPGPMVGPIRSRLERFRHLIDERILPIFEKEPPIMADDSAFFTEKQTPLGQLRYQPVSATTRVSWENAQPI